MPAKPRKRIQGNSVRLFEQNIHIAEYLLNDGNLEFDNIKYSQIMEDPNVHLRINKY